MIKSVEGSKTHNIEPFHMHHIMAKASLIISDSQTMTAEGALLGTPTVRINGFVGKISYLNEIENKYNLGIGIKPETPHTEIINQIFKLLEINKQSQLENLNILLETKVDLNQWIINFFETSIKK